MFKPFSEYPPAPLEPSEALALLRLTTNQIPDDVLTEAAARSWSCNVISKRLEPHDTTFEPKLLVMISELSNGIIGRALLIAHAIHVSGAPAKVRTLTDFCSTFPMGVPNMQEYERAWDAQKSNGANLIDNPESWKCK